VQPLVAVKNQLAHAAAAALVAVKNQPAHAASCFELAVGLDDSIQVVEVVVLDRGNCRARI
jgi:hypothetical protein